MTGTMERGVLHKKVLCIYVIMLSILLAMTGCGRPVQLCSEQTISFKEAEPSENQSYAGMSDDHTHIWVLQETHGREDPEEVIEMYGCYCGKLMSVKPGS